MKKVWFLIISLFLFIMPVSASQVKTVKIDASLNEDGSLDVVETWTVPIQLGSYFEKNFYNASNSEISDIKFIDMRGNNITEVKNFKKSKVNTWCYKDNGRSKVIEMALDVSSVGTYVISYKVSNVINHYSDGTIGLDWTFIGMNTNMSVETINIMLTNNNSFTDLNTALYGIGKDLQLNFVDNKISLNAYSWDGMSNVRLLTVFNGFTFKHYNNRDETFTDWYNTNKSQNVYLNYILNHVSYVTISIVIGILILLVVIIIISKIISSRRTHDEYYGVSTEGNKMVSEYETCKYFQEVPCNYNLYKIAYLAGYFKLANNKSDLVGALILKWVYEGNISLFTKDARPFMRINLPQTSSEATLDIDLYNLLKESSNKGIIEGSLLERYATSHYMRVMSWFNMSASNVINDEIQSGGMTRINHKQSKLQINAKLVQEAEEIQGLKKYMLNFNQVPRTTELTENKYKYLLICSELLGIGDIVGKEILRKTPENIFAQQLVQLESLRYIYKNFYLKADQLYKTTVTDHKLSSVSNDELEIDRLLKQNGK
ncbi:MAG TPA: DUF2207 domain-containing protein [Bacilli bacterium]|nr:DUF2207 domain-containing protein [Bacilli bacterium]HPZ23430.1 DUF2207 domain-containing protein [Bacilli bacterium]HQC83946.1 DUF2207 domain-containing protein [Bacilli bacterium]